MPQYMKKAQLLSLFGLDSHVDVPVKDDAESEYAQDFNVGRIRTDILQMMLRMPKNRHDRYQLLRDLDESIAASVLDLYAEESTQIIRDTSPAVQVRIKSKNAEIEKEGNKILNKFGLNMKAQPILRGIAHFGDVFYRLVFAAYQGIKFLYMIDRPETVRVVQDDYKRLVGYNQVGVEFDTNNPKQSNAWDFVHFANQFKTDLLPYGTSILHNSFRSLRQMILTEDSVLLYRLLRHPDRDLHIIDSGDADETDQRKILNRWVNDYRRKYAINPSQKLMDFRRLSITPTEDLFITKNRESQTSIEKLPGSTNAFDVHDLFYWIDKFFGEVRVPKAFMGFEGDINKAATLTSQSIRFSRAVISLQNVFKAGIRLMLQIHFRWLSKGENDKTYDWTIEGKDFEVQMAFTSGLAELDWINLMMQRSQYAEQLSGYLNDPYINHSAMLNYIFSDILKLPEVEIGKLVRETPDMSMMPDMGRVPGMSALKKARGKTASPAEKAAAENVVKNMDFKGFVDELAWYLDEIGRLSQNSTPITPIDKGEFNLSVDNQK